MVKRFIPRNTVYVRYLPEKGWSAKLYSNKYRLPNKKVFETLQNLYDEFSVLNPWREPIDETSKELRQNFVEKSGRPYDEVDINIHYKYKHRVIRICMGWEYRFVPSVADQSGERSLLNHGGFYNLDDAMNAGVECVNQDVAQSSSWVAYKIGVVLKTCWRIFLCFPIISAIVVLFCIFNPSPEKIRWIQKHPNWKTAIGVSSFMTLLIVLYIGTKESLFFIPEDWGEYDDDGDWTNYRDFAAGILAFFCSLGAVRLVSNLYETESTKLMQNNKN